ncbi:MAG TPA: hypothetical protein VHD36_08700 [Pirellulales bacterium]|nr:hypothetical protein [Pirellulales bacterium]
MFEYFASLFTIAPRARLLAAAGLLTGVGLGTQLRAADPNAGLADRVQGLIVRLGDNDYFVRERAQGELGKIGFEAFDALEVAAENDDIEIASRAKALVNQMQIEWTTADDPPEVKKQLHNYGLKDEAAHIALIAPLAEIPGDKGLPVLCRLVRFDKSPVLSKLAALAIIEQKKPGAESWPAREKTIKEVLGNSPRAAAEWLRTYLAAQQDPAAAIEAWGKLAELEQHAMPQHTQPQIVCALWRQQVAVLRKLDRRDEAVASMMKIVDLEEGHSETLAELVRWLVEQEAWDVVDTVAKRFADRIDREPILLYTLAQAQQVRGNEALAQQTAERALKLNEGNSFDKLVQHVEAARELQRRGMLKWCQQEYMHVISTGAPGDFITLFAQRGLAELAHDQGDDALAAKVWEEAVKAREAKEKNKEGDVQDLANRFGPIETMRARMHFFKACRYLAEGNTAEQLVELKAGLEDDPTEIDVLIAMYHYPNLDAELKEKTRRLLNESIESFRRDIQESPDDATNYNQLAWLIANTEGDPQEARRNSERSLEIIRAQSDDKEGRSSEAGYLDTLARCHYACGDLVRAVETQTKAIELDPHSGQMRKQLKLFKSELEKSERKGP